MPIECSVEIAKLTTNVLKELDNVVMGHAFDSQNCLGRLADELIYQSDLAHRLSSTTRCDSYFPINAKLNRFSVLAVWALAPVHAFNRG